MNRRVLATVLFLALASPGCWFKKSKPAAPAPPAPVSTPKEPVIEEPVPRERPQQQQLPPAPLPQSPAAAQPAPPQQGPVVRLPDPRENASPRPASSRKRSSRSQAPKPAETETPAQPQGPAPPPLPQLGVLLSPEERKSLEQEYARRLKSAKALVVVITNRKLDPSQKEALQRIESFLGQAQDQLGRDLSTAVQLARRAELLAQELYNALP